MLEEPNFKKYLQKVTEASYAPSNPIRGTHYLPLQDPANKFTAEGLEKAYEELLAGFSMGPLTDLPQSLLDEATVPQVWSAKCSTLHTGVDGHGLAHMKCLHPNSAPRYVWAAPYGQVKQWAVDWFELLQQTSKKVVKPLVGYKLVRTYLDSLGNTETGPYPLSFKNCRGTDRIDQTWRVRR